MKVAELQAEWANVYAKYQDVKNNKSFDQKLFNIHQLTKFIVYHGAMFSCTLELIIISLYCCIDKLRRKHD